MRASLSQLGNILPIPKLFRQLEQEMETVIKVLQPGPLGIIEHKFSAEEIREANATVRKAVENWRRNAIIEHRNGILKDYIHRPGVVHEESCFPKKVYYNLVQLVCSTVCPQVKFESFYDMACAITAAAEDLLGYTKEINLETFAMKFVKASD
ncbi:Zinc metalloproteinase aureolysin [Gossypium arboreum]|uniref:Zinc metalloproteinase aureolysin n=7 Tax=Gossypium TaxID=3633 RepID=A0A0B0PSB0_GOSAR|nr:Zinc metalloproteinase aureolysin [Gossypium arboreum]